MGNPDDKDGRTCTKMICCIGCLVIFSVTLICLGGGSIPFLSNFYKKTVKEVSVFFVIFNRGGYRGYAKIQEELVAKTSIVIWDYL